MVRFYCFVNAKIEKKYSNIWPHFVFVSDKQQIPRQMPNPTVWHNNPAGPGMIILLVLA